jgi:glycosyltransferase involved in cell wall biosynthesis
MINQNIDIILPNYNKKPYITECLVSLVSQTYQNWRCIVVDGFSNDGSWEIIQNFAQNDSRFELYQMPRTGNLYRAWNFGLSKVTNPYFCILTSDDVWDKNWLEVAVHSLEINKTAICAAARTKTIDSNSQWGNIAINSLMGERFFRTEDSQIQLRDGITSSIANYFLGSIYTSIHSLLIRSDVLKQGERFAEDVGSTADYEWYIRLSFYGNVIYHPEIEVGWRFYEGQATIPTNQVMNGNFIQKIHARTRNEIARKLDSLADEFREMAQQYDRQVLSYHYGRPCLVNLHTKPTTEFMKLLRICFKYPRAIFMDSLLKIEGKSYYVEESLYIARKMLNVMLSQKP